MKLKNNIKDVLKYKKIYVFFLCFYVFFCVKYAFSSSLDVKLFCDKNEVYVNEKVKVTAIIEWQEDKHITIEKVTDPVSSGLELVDKKQVVSSQLRENGVFFKKIINYLFNVKKTDNKNSNLFIEIEPLVLECVNNNDSDNKFIVKSNSLNIKVVSIFFVFFKKCMYGVLFLLFCSFIFLFVYLFRKKILNKKNKNTDCSDFSFEKDCFKEIEEINKHKVFGDIKKYYSCIYSILSNYLEKKYKIKSFNEINSKFNIPEDLKNVFCKTQNLNEKVCFAGYVPTKNEQENLSREIERYFKLLLAKEKINIENDIKIINKGGI